MGPIHRDVETSCIETRARGQPGPTPDSNHRVTNTKGEFMTRYLHSDLGHPESPLSATRRSAGSADPFPARQVTTPHRTGASRPAPAPPPPIPSRPPQPPSRRRLRRSPLTAGGRSEAREPGQAPELQYRNVYGCDRGGRLVSKNRLGSFRSWERNEQDPPEKGVDVTPQSCPTRPCILCLDVSQIPE